MLSILGLNAFAASKHDENILRAMRDEINRSMDKLKLESLQKPYYIEYKITMNPTYSIKSVLGSLVASDWQKNNNLTVGVRVGNYKFDNTNFFDVGLNFFGSGDDEERFASRSIPLELDYETLRRELWLATDAAYKQASEIFSKKESSIKNKMRKDTTHDFLYIAPDKIYENIDFPVFDANYFESVAKSMSAKFISYPEIQVSSVGVEYATETVYFVNSEGREYVKSNTYTGIELSAAGQAEDGMPLMNFYSAYSPDPQQLPSKDSLDKAALSIADKFRELYNAKALEDSYSGPVLFTDQAAAEVFAQNFAPNLVAQREPLSDGGFSTSDKNNAFKNKVGGRVLPEFLNVESAPAKSSINNVPIIGKYILDDDGVKPQDIKIVQSGYLKTLLSSRIPTKRVRESNGSKKGGAAMYSTLILTAEKGKTASYPELKKRLMKLCKDRELPYGILVKKAMNPNILFTGVLRLTQEYMSYMRSDGGVVLVEVYKVYPDGREELIRGGNGAGFSPAAFKDIIASGKNQTVYNFLAGTVVSSFISGGSSYTAATVAVPDLLFEDAEIRTIDEDFKKTPILANPLK